jgi:hypothetical protein
MSGTGPPGTTPPTRNRDERIAAIAALDGWECHYCSEPLGWGHPIVTAPQIDHVIPRAMRGPDDVENLALACGPCNMSKGARPPWLWLNGICCERHVDVILDEVRFATLQYVVALPLHYHDREIVDRECERRVWAEGPPRLAFYNDPTHPWYAPALASR